MQLFSEDYLMHYGVKGMKWKKRKHGLEDDRPGDNVGPEKTDDFDPLEHAPTKQDLEFLRAANRRKAERREIDRRDAINRLKKKRAAKLTRRASTAFKKTTLKGHRRNKELAARANEARARAASDRLRQANQR